jgi:multiple sugar transport system permease protein
MTRKDKDIVSGYLLVLPAALMSLVFFLLPFLVMIGLSFFDVTFSGESRGFMGFRHYIDFFASSRSLRSLWISFIFLLVCLPCTVVFSFSTAMLLRKPFIGQGFFRTMNILPWVVAGVSSAFMFRWLFNETSAGLINKIITGLGMERIYWLSDAKMNFVVVMICVIWKAIPMPMLVFLSGM